MILYICYTITIINRSYSIIYHFNHMCVLHAKLRDDHVSRNNTYL